MGPVDYLVICIMVIVIGLAALYVIRAKKKGRKCIGCPSGASCPHGGNCAACSGIDNQSA